GDAQRPNPDAVSSMPGTVREAGRIEAEQLHCRDKSLGRGPFEDNPRLRFHGQPGILPQFLFQLSRCPAGVAEGHEDIVQTGALTLTQGLQDIFGSRESDLSVYG